MDEDDYYGEPEDMTPMERRKRIVQLLATACLRLLAERSAQAPACPVSIENGDLSLELSAEGKVMCPMP
ncbi:MAG: hypothetical protein A2992_06500 [Elusimicrobia bacterium RIFCSPLOWO2_01_FULL_59_12]|nr:MAG: hypothetical protein A2992_06500 [Elusimicrobia bacterium RIFCSPLOWO2_01_FULL_59_12]